MSIPDTVFTSPVSVPETVCPRELICVPVTDGTDSVIVPLCMIVYVSSFPRTSQPEPITNGDTVYVAPSIFPFDEPTPHTGVLVGAQGALANIWDGDCGDWGSVGSDDMHETRVLVEHSLPHGDGRLTRVPPLSLSSEKDQGIIVLHGLFSYL